MRNLQEKIQEYIASNIPSKKFDFQLNPNEKYSIKDILEFPIEVNSKTLTLSSISGKLFKKEIETIFNKLFDNIEYDSNTEDFFISIVSKNIFVDKFFEFIKKRENSVQDKVYGEINSLKFLDIVCKKHNLDPWKIININGYEIFLPANVLMNQYRFSVDIENSYRDSYDEQVDYFLDNIKEWVNKSTDNTSHKEMNARSIYPLLYTNNLKNMNDFFNKAGLKPNDLDINASINFKTTLIGTFHTCCARNGKYIFLNKFIDQKNNTSFEDFVCSMPYKKDLITNKRAFFKELRNTSISFSKEDFKTILNNIYRKTKRQYKNSDYTVKCYFPFKLDIINNWKNLSHKDIGDHNTVYESKEHLVNLIDVAVEKYPDFFKSSDVDFLSNTVVAFAKIKGGRECYKFLQKDDNENSLYTSIKLLNRDDKQIVQRKILDNIDKIFSINTMSGFKQSIIKGFFFNIPIHHILIEVITDLKINENDIKKIESIYDNFRGAKTDEYKEMNAILLSNKLNDSSDSNNFKAKAKI